MAPQKQTSPPSLKASSIIHLNVGGVNYTTLYKTISVSIFFQNLLMGIMGKTTAGDGSVFVDRDGKLFRDVLLYLRTSLIFTKDREKLQSLLLEAQFYQIGELETKLASLINDATQQEEAHPPIIWKRLDEISANLGISTFVLTERTGSSERSYQILDVVGAHESPLSSPLYI
ncbi:hypothetical protein MBANPS3_000886 [Mucor bainieri]